MKKEALGRTNRLRLGSKTGVRYALSEERSNLRREARKEGRREGKLEAKKERGKEEDWQGMREGGQADRKSTRLNSSHVRTSRMPSSA